MRYIDTITRELSKLHQRGLVIFEGHQLLIMDQGCLNLVNTAGKGQVAAVAVQDDLVVVIFSRILQLGGWLN